MVAITKEMVETRKADLIKGMEQKRAELNALVGALQDCEYWLSQIVEEEKTEG
jgi:hypothetical protein